jgi:6-phosphogluconolactonase
VSRRGPGRRGPGNPEGVPRSLGSEGVPRSTGSPPELEVVADAAALAEAAARRAVADLEAAVEAHGSATWVLTGGSTPLAAYRRLAASDLRAGVEWDRVRVAIGDERCVPVGHPDSNWGQAAAALLDHVPLPQHQRLRIRGELPADRAADDYQEALGGLPERTAGVPRLEVVWLGVGEDGHCLSLFPGRPEVEVADRLVVAVHHAPKPPPERVSLTLAALAGAERLLVLAAGAAKAGPVARAKAGDQRLPLGRAVEVVRRAGGAVAWLLDRAAAGG